MRSMPPATALRAVKLLHTAVWAFFAGCILAIPLAAARARFAAAVWLIGIVSLEVVVIVLNRWRCPLTDVAARYTTDRHDNFDIYLPLWLARHNKAIFGAIFLGAVAFTWIRWASM